MVARWRCLRGTLVMNPGNATSVISACCVLHNFLRNERCEDYCPPGFGDTVDTDGRVVPGTWRVNRDGFEDIDRTVQRHPTHTATAVRDLFTNYFNNEGALPWQTAYVNRT